MGWDHATFPRNPWISGAFLGIWIVGKWFLTWLVSSWLRKWMFFSDLGSFQKNMDSMYRMMNTHLHIGLGLLKSVFDNNLALLENSRCYLYSRMLHVWYIYLHLHAFTINLSQMRANMPYMEHLGFIYPNCFKDCTSGSCFQVVDAVQLNAGITLFFFVDSHKPLLAVKIADIRPEEQWVSRVYLGRNKTTSLAILRFRDPFGMVKTWPFQMVKWHPTTVF